MEVVLHFEQTDLLSIQKKLGSDAPLGFFIIDESGITEDLYHRKLQTKADEGRGAGRVHMTGAI